MQIPFTETPSPETSLDRSQIPYQPQTMETRRCALYDAGAPCTRCRHSTTAEEASAPLLSLLCHLAESFQAARPDGLEIRSASAIECANRSNSVAGWKPGRSRPVVVQRLGRKKALALEFVLCLSDGTLRQRQLRATNGGFLSLSKFRSAVVRLANGNTNILRGGLLDIEFASLDKTLLIIIGPLQDRPTPLSHKSVSDTLDAGLRAFAPRVKENHFANATAQQGVLVDGKLGKSCKDVSLNIVGR